MSGSEERGSVARQGIGAAFRVYQHVAAVLATIALASLVAKAFDYGWRGVIAELITYWDQYARPVARAFVDAAIVTPLGWVGLRIELDEAAIDYLAVGLIATTSWSRQWSRLGESYAEPGWPPWKRYAAQGVAGLYFGFLCVFFWWMLVAAFSFFAFVGVVRLLGPAGENDREEVRVLAGMLLTLLPLIYLGVLFAANQML